MATERETQAPTDRELCGLVKVLSNQIEANIRGRAATLGLTASQGTALCELTRPMTLRELAERMGCEPSNVTFVADRLEEQGYLERHPHPDDRRAKQLVLTPKGTELRRRLLELLSENSPLAPLAPEEQDVLQQLLTRALIR
ncbi:MarR family winged helix-turn-helix transcriptional regulator [Microbispora bryophytorum]|uniref:MarR family transcriptional regulator n=1 Tax=Microbispora bryophytorum TaxID=1460882 RepID=A0A8H9H4S3_9ACTN|nr:MarR family transcriptional regulator [Microbispora bryophytorum]MBD3139797.1 MarR family transcriptional regulator [Microbispora bryophytorum]TQS02659.1 MarR family transcriptional regulator [Microbispora bryophytorum]GGO27255.1 MarR family transcriptional regulator [Microbispora bryophytorum]